MTPTTEDKTMNELTPYDVADALLDFDKLGVPQIFNLPEKPDWREGYLIGFRTGIETRLGTLRYHQERAVAKDRALFTAEIDLCAIVHTAWDTHTWWPVGSGQSAAARTFYYSVGLGPGRIQLLPGADYVLRLGLDQTYNRGPNRVVTVVVT